MKAVAYFLWDFLRPLNHDKGDTLERQNRRPFENELLSIIQRIFFLSNFLLRAKFYIGNGSMSQIDVHDSLGSYTEGRY